MAVQLMSKAAYARHRGCDEKAVRKAIAEGRISTIDGKIDPEVADIQWAKNTRARADSKRTAAGAAIDAGTPLLDGEPAASGSDSAPSAPAAPGYADYRAMREKADAEMAVRANLKDAGLLVERAQAQRGTFDVVRAYRDSVMVIGQRAAPRCIGLADSREIEHVIVDETRKALEGFEARMAALLPTKEAL
ncbi:MULTISPECIES: hypothetical protein [unclassified Acidovorax]|uniref:hypothetical protein n=1 Tax=unclassified Acidovorax TaxID=2684926 RepID=UPI001C474B42|nr:MULTISPECIES: hypothetical protein [unclassified Acidovorax]MBV7459473.1 hypothetical protein [Acidovorax sp. sif0632]MBV7464498.1 hypothetical protein [Acidovorax sp. sif0613]